MKNKTLLFIFTMLLTFIITPVYAETYLESTGSDVAVRTGLQCSPLAHKTLKTFPAGTVRFSVQYYTSDSDFDGLKNALDYIKENI